MMDEHGIRFDVRSGRAEHSSRSGVPTQTRFSLDRERIRNS
jgi:hypothetical protein